MSKEDAYMDGLLAKHLAQYDDADWICDRKNELMKDQDFLEKSIEYFYDRNDGCTLVNQLLIDMLELSLTADYKLLHSNLLERLNDFAVTFYSHVDNEAHEQAEKDFEKISTQYANDKAEALYDDQDY